MGVTNSNGAPVAQLSQRGPAWQNSSKRNPMDFHLFFGASQIETRHKSKYFCLGNVGETGSLASRNSARPCSKLLQYVLDCIGLNCYITIAGLAQQPSYRKSCKKPFLTYTYKDEGKQS
jgi:hypothetical protein